MRKAFRLIDWLKKGIIQSPLHYHHHDHPQSTIIVIINYQHHQLPTFFLTTEEKQILKLTEKDHGIS